MHKKDIIEKIKKLLALANSSNEHEAKVASARAQALLTKYNLTMSEVDKKESEYQKSLHETDRQRVSVEWKYIQDIVRTYFFVEIVQTKKPYFTGDLKVDMFGPSYKFCYLLLGREHNIEIAEYMIDFFDKAFKSCFKQYRKETGAGVGTKQSYYYGLHSGIVEQLKKSRQQVEQETGLVVVEDADLGEFVQNAFKKDLVKSQSNVSVKDAEAVSAGYDKGKDLNIARGLGGSGEKKQVEQTLRLGGNS